MFIKTSLAAFVVIAATFGSGLARAHPILQSAEPAMGTASAAPQRIKMIFNENILPLFSGIDLKDQTGKTFATGKTTTDPKNKKVMIVPLTDQLTPGDYKVEWHAVSDDTHRVKGSYSFSVTP